MTEDTSKSFWEQRTEFKMMEPFKSLYKKDTSSGKKVSSLMMWFIFLCYSKESDYHAMPRDEKHEAIGKGLTDNVAYYEMHQERLDELIDVFVRIHYTTLEHQLASLDNLMEKRRKALDKLDYTGDADTDVKIDKFISNSKGIFEQYSVIRKLVEEEKNSGIARGDQVMSATDQGLL